MKEKTITITQDELEKVIYEEVMKERHMIFKMRLEDYCLLPVITERKRKGRSYVTMSKKAWESHEDYLSQVLGDLATARELIEKMEPVYNEFYGDYEKRHDFNFSEYMKLTVASYDAEEFERVRERFEEEFFKDEDMNSVEIER